MAIKDCIEHLYSWDYTIPDAIGCPGCAERERIIKLLEGCLQDEEWHIRNVMCCGENPCRENWLDTIINTDGTTARQGVIALIKGENK